MNVLCAVISVMSLKSPVGILDLSHFIIPVIVDVEIDLANSCGHPFKHVL